MDCSGLVGGRYGVVLDTIVLVSRGGFTNQGDKETESKQREYFVRV